MAITGYWRLTMDDADAGRLRTGPGSYLHQMPAVMTLNTPMAIYGDEFGLANMRRARGNATPELQSAEEVDLNDLPPCKSHLQELRKNNLKYTDGKNAPSISLGCIWDSPAPDAVTPGGQAPTGRHAAPMRRVLSARRARRASGEAGRLRVARLRGAAVAGGARRRRRRGVRPAPGGGGRGRPRGPHPRAAPRAGGHLRGAAGPPAQLRGDQPRGDVGRPLAGALGAAGRGGRGRGAGAGFGCRHLQELLLVGPGDREPVLAAEMEVEERRECLVAPVAVHLQQYRVERILHDALAALPAGLVDMRWCCTVEGVSADEEGVALQCTSPGANGKPASHELKSSYVVICNAAAKLRLALGETTPNPAPSDRVTQTVLSVDLELRDGTARADRRLLLASRAEGVVDHAVDTMSWLSVSQRSHPDGLIRLDAILPAGVDLHKVSTDRAAEDLARGVLGEGAARAVRGSVAQQFRAGAAHRASQGPRVYLCGEALAVTSPFGGALGSKAWPQDAANLAWKLALVLLQGAPAALLETYPREREAARAADAAARRRGERLLAPAAAAQREVRLAALSLLRSGQELGAALLADCGALPCCSLRSGSPLLLPDEARHGGPSGAQFQAGAPGPGDVLADCAVEDLHAMLDGESQESSRQGPTFLLRHTGAFFTAVFFAMTVGDIPWEALKLIDRPRTQMTTELLRRVVVVLDASALERMSEEHATAVGLARRIGVRLMADREGSAVRALDARPGTVVLVRPDLHVAARWRELRPRDVSGALLRATGHFLHESPLADPTALQAHAQPLASTQVASASAAAAALHGPAAQAAACRLLDDLVERLASVPSEGRLTLLASAVMLTAARAGSWEAAERALALAASAALCGQPSDDGAELAYRSPRGSRRSQPADATSQRWASDAAAATEASLPLRLQDHLAASFEAGGLGTGACWGHSAATGTAAGTALLGELLGGPLGEAPGVSTGLVSAEVAAECLARALQQDPDAGFACSPPPAGLRGLRERLAGSLSQAEGLDLTPDGVFVLEGPCAALRHLLRGLLAPPEPAPARGTPAGGAGGSAAADVGGGGGELHAPPPLAEVAADGPEEGVAAREPGEGAGPGPPAEVLLVGACPEAWLPALGPWRVRRFDPPGGAEGGFRVRAEDVARNVAAETRAVLLPLFSAVTGLALEAPELSALGRFVDLEARRRQRLTPAGAGHGLVLLVDVTARGLQLDVGAAGEALPVLSRCQQCVVFGELFGGFSPAPALQAQYAAATADALRGALAAAAAAARAAGSGACGGSLAQALAAALPQEVRCLEGLRRRREVLCEALQAAGLAVVGGRPRAGHWLAARLPEDVDEVDYCDALDSYGVRAVAGAPFGVPGCVRLDFAVPFDALEDSLGAYAAAVQDVRQWQRDGGARGPRYMARKQSARNSMALAVAKGDVHALRASVADAEAARLGAPELAAASEALAVLVAQSDGAEEAGATPAGSLADAAGESLRSETPDVQALTAELDADAEGGEELSEASGGAEAPREAEADVEADAADVAAAEQAGRAAHLGAQLRRGARALACVVQTTGSITTELIAQAGFELSARSALGAGSHAVLRLPEAEVSLVSRALDAGAEGVLLPRVASPGEAEAFAALVQEARDRLRGDDAIEWHEECEEEEPEAPAKQAGQQAMVDPAVPHATPPPPRPLVAVELDPASGLDVAEAVLEVAGIDLVLVDPDRAAEHIAARHGCTYQPSSRGAALVEDGHAGDLAAGGPRVQAADGDAAAAEEDPPRGASPTAEGEMQPTAPQSAAPAFRRGVGARRSITEELKAPSMGPRRQSAAAALSSRASEELAQFWARFDALPARAAECQKLLGCCAHTRSSPVQLLQAGHCVVVIAVDTALLREGAVRHAAEMKTDRDSTQRLFVTPLESARARLASSALVAQLRRHKVALGAFVHLSDPLTTETLSLAGFEAVVLDHEQGPGDLVNAVGQIHAASSAGAHTLLRVPGQDQAYLRRALQLGVDGIILPHTESAEQAADFVALARRCWPSAAQRSGGGPVASVLRPNAGAASMQHLRRRGEELLLKACQVETEAGLAAVADIARVEGVDMVFFAPVELAASICRGAEAGTLSALEGAEAEVKKAKKLLGGMLVPGRSAEQMFALGYDLICTTSDVILLRSAAENVIRETKPPASGPTAGCVSWVASGRRGRLARDEETLVARLKKSRDARALGVMARFGSPSAAELVARCGFEVVVVDHARGPGDLLGAVGLVHAAARMGAHAMIRVPGINPAHLRRALQLGVEGVISAGLAPAAAAGIRQHTDIVCSRCGVCWPTDMFPQRALKRASLADCRTHNGKVHPTYEETLRATGQFVRDDEAHAVLDELIALRYTAAQLRFAFLVLLEQDAAPASLYRKYERPLMKDFLDRGLGARAAQKNCMVLLRATWLQNGNSDENWKLGRGHTFESPSEFVHRSTKGVLDIKNYGFNNYASGFDYTNIFLDIVTGAASSHAQVLLNIFVCKVWLNHGSFFAMFLIAYAYVQTQPRQVGPFVAMQILNAFHRNALSRKLSGTSIIARLCERRQIYPGPGTRVLLGLRGFPSGLMGKKKKTPSSRMQNTLDRRDALMCDAAFAEMASQWGPTGKRAAELIGMAHLRSCGFAEESMVCEIGSNLSRSRKRARASHWPDDIRDGFVLSLRALYFAERRALWTRLARRKVAELAMAPKSSNATYEYAPEQTAATTAKAADAGKNRDYVSLYTEHIHIELLDINKKKANGVRVTIADGASLRFREERKTHGLTTLWKGAVAVHDLDEAPAGAQIAQRGFTRALSKGSPNPSWAHVHAAFGQSARATANAQKHVLQTTADLLQHSYIEADFVVPPTGKHNGFTVSSVRNQNRVQLARSFKMLDGTDRTVKELHNFCVVVAKNIPEKILAPLRSLQKKCPQFITWTTCDPNTAMVDTVPSALTAKAPAAPASVKKRPAAAAVGGAVAKKPAKRANN
ncbi:unnamed protein product [Prorocentrum cordatum]|uniref:Uncharacterized protein n=2 Tax=Prorocentrum cordatum TaxID=2364126 RepID=A0ABN9S438_9DINO|nr:unnamed protein product [Polarella glacialis]